MKRYLFLLPLIALTAISWTTEGKPAKSQPAPSSVDSGDTLTLHDMVFSDFISPNGDGHNDHFVIVNVMYYPKNSIDIFNRWGDKVYHAEPYLNEWDGINNRGNAIRDERVTDGVYFYEFYDGLGNNVTGKITVKR